MLFNVSIFCKDGRVFKIQLSKSEMIQLQMDLEFSLKIKIKKESISVRDVDRFLAEAA